MTAVAASESHTCAVTQDGQLHCFGSNGAGQRDVPEGLGPVTALAATSEDSETTARRMQPLLDDIPHAPEPAVSADEAFARTAERGIQAEAVGVPVGQITADWNSPVVREALLRKGFQRRAGRLHVQVQGAAAERRDAGVHLLRRITDVTWKSRWADFVEVKDLHLADLIRQAEKHHRDRKTAPLPGDDSSGDTGALCQEYNRAPRACTSLDTYTPIITCCHDEDSQKLLFVI